MIQHFRRKKFIYFFGLSFLFPSFINATTFSKGCSVDNYTIATINGILTDDYGAKENMTALKDKIGIEYNNQKIDYQYLLNPSHLGGIGDIAMAAYQKAFEDEAVVDYDLIEMLRSANKKIKTQKLLLVAHSQGNFYANSFYDTVVNEPESIPAQSIGVYAVATPAKKVAGGGKWITSGTDNTIVGYVGGVLGRKILPPNVYIKEFSQFSPSFDYGHSFSDAYLQYEGGRIVSEIKQSLGKLSADENRREDAPCISSPKSTLNHKIEGAVLSVVDPIAVPIVGAFKNSISSLYATTMLISKLGLALAKSTIFSISLFAQTTERMVVAVSSSVASVYEAIRNNQNNTVNNSASVLLATTPLQETSPAETLPVAPTLQSTPKLAISENILQAPTVPSPVATTNPTQTETLSAEIVTSKIAPTSPTNTVTLSGFDLGGGVGPTQTTSTETNNSSSISTGGNTATTATTSPTTTTDTTTTTSSQAASTTPATNPSENTTTTKTKTIFAHPYIGTPIEIGNSVSASMVRSFPNPDRTEDVYRIRVKKASNFDCKKDVGSSYISAGDSSFETRIVQLDTSSAITDGAYCEYGFTNDYHGPVIKATMPINKIYFSTRNRYDYLDGSIFNDGSSTDTYGIKTMLGGYAFELCGEHGCTASFKFPPDSVTPSMPSRQTYLHSPTFSGTYNNNATFNKIVFELKNTTLGTDSVVERLVVKTGSIVPYNEQLDLPTGGDWQYRVRLEDSVTASSTPWSSLAAFTLTPRTPENQKNAKTIYANSYMGTPIDVGSSNIGNSSMISFTSSSRNEDVYSVRFKKSSKFDCRVNIARGFLMSGYSPVARKVVDLDIATATGDDTHCEYSFTDNQTAIPANTDLSYISFFARQNDEHAFLDGSSMNNGRTMADNGIWYATPTYAFQLCNMYGCSEEFKVSSSGTASSTLSSARAITNFALSVATSTLAGTVDEAAHTVKITVPFGIDLKSLIPSVVTSPLATSSPQSGATQDFSSPINYTVTAEDGSTQTYIVTITAAPDTTLPAILSYTFNGIAGDIVTNFSTTTATTTPPVTVTLTANKNVDWVSMTIEDQNNSNNYKRFLSSSGCVDGTATCEKTWDGGLSHGTMTPNSIYRVKVHLKDAMKNGYNDYLLPYKITVN